MLNGEAAVHEIDDRYWRGVDLFNSGEYFEAHEVWEEIWAVAKGPERRFLQALIHFAVGCYHHGRGNRVGAVRQWDKGVTKIQAFRPHWHGIQTESLVHAAKSGLGEFPPIERTNI